MRTLAVITARAGSKRLPRKNLEMLGQFPLVCHAVAHARDAQISDIIVSTDDVGIAGAVGIFGPMVNIRMRPLHLSGDDVDSIAVVRDAYNWHGGQSKTYDATLLLQPTSPFRTPGDIVAALALFDGIKADAVISVTDASVESVYQVAHAGRLRPVESLPGLVVPNGAIYILSVDAMLRGLDWESAPLLYGYPMPRARSLDIDTQVDLDRARALWAEQEEQART